MDTKTATTLLRIAPDQRERYERALEMVRLVNTFDIMETHIRAEEQWEQKSHYASRIVECPRAHWYALKGVKRSNPFTLTQAMKMALGSAVGDIVGDRIEAAMTLATKDVELPFKDILETAEAWSPQLLADILAAVKRKHEEPEKMSEFELGKFTVREVPFRIEIPGFEFPLGARVDLAYLTPAGVPMLVELKSSSAFMTQMVREKQDTLVNYKLQAFTYLERYGIPTEIHYWDREWGYPYRFGLTDSFEGPAYLQPGGLGRMGRDLAQCLNGMHPSEFILARLGWYEELLKSDTPPGEVRTKVILSPRGKESKEFVGAKLLGLSDHPTYLGDFEENYELYCEHDGTLIGKRQADNVEYKTGLCGRYCGYRDTCMASAGLEMRPEPAADFTKWGAPKEAG
jgi:hypothetical protein